MFCEIPFGKNPIHNVCLAGKMFHGNSVYAEGRFMIILFLLSPLLWLIARKLGKISYFYIYFLAIVCIEIYFILGFIFD
jgi:hypothetical protein